MKNQIAQVLSRMRPRVRDVVGIDIGASGVKAVRLRVDRGGHITVVAADALPKLAFPGPAGGAGVTLVLPKSLQAWTASVAYSFPQAGMKLLTLPSDKVENSAYADLLGIARSPDMRLGHLAFDSDNRNDIPVLAVGVPVAEIDWLRSLLPTGKPALSSVEISGLAALTAYQQICVDLEQPRCDLVIDAGERVTTMSICFKGKPLVMRQFMQGAATVVEQVMQDLGVDAATAHDILNVGSIDVRSSLHRVYEGFLRQLGIAIDFAERRSGKRLQKIFLSGGLAANHDFCEELHDQVGLLPEVWNPLGRMAVLPNALSAQVKGNESCFVAATGAALGLLEVS
jgi:Tfp pilus assembly PilM family ATPase